QHNDPTRLVTRAAARQCTGASGAVRMPPIGLVDEGRGSRRDVHGWERAKPKRPAAVKLLEEAVRDAAPGEFLLVVACALVPRRTLEGERAHPLLIEVLVQRRTQPARET